MIVPGKSAKNPGSKPKPAGFRSCRFLLATQGDRSIVSNTRALSLCVTTGGLWYNNGNTFCNRREGEMLHAIQMYLSRRIRRDRRI